MKLTMDDGKELIISKLQSFTINEKQKVLITIPATTQRENIGHIIESFDSFFGIGGWLLTTEDSTKYLPLTNCNEGESR